MAIRSDIQQLEPGELIELYELDCSTPEIMANIVAELQSLRSRVASLESEVETLKSQGNI